MKCNTSTGIVWLYGIFDWTQDDSSIITQVFKKKKNRSVNKLHLTKSFSKQDATEYMELRTKLKEN